VSALATAEVGSRGAPAPAGRSPAGTAAVLAPVLLAVVLTAWRYDAKPLWRDEVYTLTTAGRGFADMLDLLVVRDAGLFGYYALMNPWLAVSEAPAWMRLPGALATPVVVGLCAAIGRRLGGPSTALVSGLLVALTPSVVRHAQEARPYPLVLAAVTLTALLLLRAHQRPSPGERVGAAAAAALAVALHPLVALPAVAGLFAAAWLTADRDQRRPVVAAAAPATAIGLALVAVGALQAAASPPARATAAEYLTFWRIVTGSPTLGLAVLALAVAGAVLLRHRRREALLVTAWAVAPVAAVTLLGLSGSYFNARYATACVPAVCVLVALAVGAGHRALLRAAPRWAPVGLAAAVVAVVAVQAPAALAHRAAPYYFDDAPGAARQLAVASAPGDAVAWVGPVARPLVAPHLSRSRGTQPRDALLVAPPEGSATLGGLEVAEDRRRAALAPHRRVWLVGTRATATDDLSRRSPTARAATAGRELVSRQDHGWVRVELWITLPAAG
jgi:mannosyltransferase